VRKERRNVLSFRGIIMFSIFDPVQDENGSWRIGKNHELNELIGSTDIV